MRFRTDFGLGRRSFRSIGHMTFGQLDSVKILATWVRSRSVRQISWLKSIYLRSLGLGQFTERFQRTKKLCFLVLQSLSLVNLGKNMLVDYKLFI